MSLHPGRHVALAPAPTHAPAPPFDVPVHDGECEHLRERIASYEAEVHRLLLQQVRWAARVNEANHEAKIARELGRREAAGAVTFATSCLSCADMLAQMYETEQARDRAAADVLAAVDAFAESAAKTFAGNEVATALLEALRVAIAPHRPDPASNPSVASDAA